MLKNLKSICSKNHLKYLVFLFLGMVVAAIIEMIGLSSVPLFIMIIVDIDVLVNKFPNFFANEFIKGFDQSYLTIFGGILLISIFLIKNVYLSLFLYFQGKVIRVLKTDISNTLFKKYIYASYNFHIKNNPAILVRNIHGSIQGAISTILSSLSITRESLILVVVFILLFLNQPMVSVTVFIVLLSISGSFLYFTRKIVIRKGEEVAFVQGSKLRTINHALGSIRETKILNRENYLVNLFNSHIYEIEKHTFFMHFLSQTPRLFLEFIAVFAVSIIAILFVLIKMS